MERTLTAHTLPLPSPSVLSRLLPLWRHAAFLLALFTVLAVGALVRLDVQQLRKDLDRTSRATLEAQVLHDRLVLEMEARRRAVAMEQVAGALGLDGRARLAAPVQVDREGM